MNLSELTTAELRAELQRRESAVIPETDHIPHIGIIDSDGLDSITAVPDANTFAQVIRTMELRTRFNSQRKAEIFFVKIPPSLATQAMKNPEKGGEIIKGLSNYQKIY